MFETKTTVALAAILAACTGGAVSRGEGIAWCDDDVEIAFCSRGAWWVLDCSAVADFCGHDGLTVDCYAADEL